METAHASDEAEGNAEAPENAKLKERTKTVIAILYWACKHGPISLVSEMQDTVAELITLEELSEEAPATTG